MGQLDGGFDTLWLPKSYQDLRMMPPTSIVYKDHHGSISVVETAPQVVIKYGGTFSEEITCAVRAAAPHGMSEFFKGR